MISSMNKLSYEQTSARNSNFKNQFERICSLSLSRRYGQPKKTKKAMSWKISFHVIGDDYSPKKVNFKFHEENEPDEIAQIGRFKGRKYGYGSSLYTVPNEIERLNVFQHLAEPLTPTYGPRIRRFITHHPCRS